MKGKIKKLISVFVLLTAIFSWDVVQGADSLHNSVKETFDTVDSVLRPGAVNPPPNQEIQSNKTSSPAFQPVPGVQGQPNKKSPDLTGKSQEQPSEVNPTLLERFLKRRSLALVIGINDYSHLDKLDNGVRDACSVAKALQEHYGFEIRLLLDKSATREEIMRILNELRRTLKENDQLLIYYSGHGYYDRESGTSYWLPADAEPNDNTRWLDTRSITDQFKLISARQVLVVADSCFAGAMTRSSSADLSRTLGRDAYLMKMLEKTTRVLIASGGNESVADSGASEHSVFTDAFLRALNTPFSSAFTAEELMARHLKESVAGHAEQFPEYKAIRNSGHDGGDFVFLKRK
jgi:hypothetical protein